MGNFFQGWRRKTGLATLLVTCTLMAGWVRSSMMFDQYYHTMKTSFFEFVSLRGVLTANFTVKTGDDPGKLFQMPNRGHSQMHASKLSIDLIPIKNYLATGGWTFQSHWEIFNFSISIVTRDNLRMTLIVCPYWMLVIPLTLVSACLLLWNPINLNSRNAVAITARDVSDAAGHDLV